MKRHGLFYRGGLSEPRHIAFAGVLGVIDTKPVLSKVTGFLDFTGFLEREPELEPVKCGPAIRDRVAGTLTSMVVGAIFRVGKPGTAILTDSCGHLD